MEFKISRRYPFRAYGKREFKIAWKLWVWKQQKEFRSSGFQSSGELTLESLNRRLKKYNAVAHKMKISQATRDLSFDEEGFTLFMLENM